MAQRALDDFEAYIRQRVVCDRISHQKLSEELKVATSQLGTGGKRGFSMRSIQRFCEEKDIHRTSRLSDTVVEQVVAEAVSKVHEFCPYSFNK